MGKFSAGQSIVKRKRPGIFSRILIPGGNLLLLWLFLSTLIAYIPTPFIRGEMFFSYPPRFIYLFLATALAFFFFLKRFFLRFFLSLLIFLLLLFQVGLGGGTKKFNSEYYTLLAFNVHDATDRVSVLKGLCDRYDVDFLVLQEVKEKNRQPFIEGLENYEFFWGDKTKEFANSHIWPFTSITGIKKSLIRENRPFIETAITDFRTFAVRLDLREGPFWLVNVHMFKPFSNQDGLFGYAGKLGRQARRHVTEGNLLKGWMGQHSSDPVIIAGDFNAPYYSRYFRLPHMHNAHREAGHGLHKTFPANFPVWGIDHSFGNQYIKFHSYDVSPAGFSDHLAQLVRFSITGGKQQS